MKVAGHFCSAFDLLMYQSFFLILERSEFSFYPNLLAFLAHDKALRTWNVFLRKTLPCKSLGLYVSLLSCNKFVSPVDISQDFFSSKG